MFPLVGLSFPRHTARRPHFPSSPSPTLAALASACRQRFPPSPSLPRHPRFSSSLPLFTQASSHLSLSSPQRPRIHRRHNALASPRRPRLPTYPPPSPPHTTRLPPHTPPSFQSTEHPQGAGQRGKDKGGWPSSRALLFITRDSPRHTLFPLSHAIPLVTRYSPRHTLFPLSCALPFSSCALPLSSCSLPLLSCALPLSSCALPLSSCALPLSSCALPLSSCALSLFL
ncbi:unnamed protein product [Closterium sp. NIES-54]